MLLLPKRKRALELIDLPSETYNRSEFSRNLEDIRKVNRYLGGNHVILKVLSYLASGIDVSSERPLRVLDVATGSADIPVSIVKWAHKNGRDVVVTAVDVNPIAVQEAVAFTKGYPDITISVADGLSLPYRDDSFDIVLCSKTLHHFSEENTVNFIKEIRRVASIGYIITDLRRSWVAWALIYMLTRLFTRNRLTRHDGPMSVRRSYTDTELGDLAEKAGLAGHRVTRESFWLIAVSGRKV